MFAWIATHPYAYPLLEAVHIVGIALLLGNLVLFELRVFGLGSQLPVQPLARLALRLSLAGFALAALSGGAMFASQADELLANRAFLVKMGLVVTAGAMRRCSMRAAEWPASMRWRAGRPCCRWGYGSRY